MQARYRYTLSLAFVLLAALVVGCSIYSRHPDKEKYGEETSKAKMEDALNNMDKMMGMDMDSRKQHMMETQQKSIAMGKALFNDPKLGSNGQTCNSCHPNGTTTGGESEIAKKMGHGPYKLPIPSLVGAAARFPKYKVPNDRVITLEVMNNNCIRMFMKGKRLPLDSPESYLLAQYVTSLSNGDEITVGGN